MLPNTRVWDNLWVYRRELHCITIPQISSPSPWWSGVVQPASIWCIIKTKNTDVTAASKTGWPRSQNFNIGLVILASASTFWSRPRGHYFGPGLQHLASFKREQKLTLIFSNGHTKYYGPRSPHPHPGVGVWACWTP